MALLSFLKDSLRKRLLPLLIIVFTLSAYAGVFYDSLNVDNLQLDGNTVSTTDSNGPLYLSTNGTGDVFIQDDADVMGDLTVQGIITEVDGWTLDTYNWERFSLIDQGLATTDDVTFDALTLTDPVTLGHEATPSNPSAGNLKVYAKNDDKLYTLDSSGTETEVGGAVDLSAVAQDVLPSATDTYDIGSSSKRWQLGYFNVGVIDTVQLGSAAVGYFADSGTSPSGTSLRAKLEVTSDNSNLGIFTTNRNTANKTNNILIETGNQTGTGDTGDISLRTGTISSGTRGSIAFKDGSEGTSGHCWTSTGTGGEGNWQACAGGGSGDLWSDAVDANIVPDTDDAYTLGSSSNKFSDLYTNYADISITNLFSTTWGTNIPAVIIDGTGSEATTAFGGGIVYDATGAQSNFLVGTKDLSSGTTTDMYVFTGSGSSTAASGDLYVKSGDAASGTSGDLLLKSGNSTSNASGDIVVQTGTSGTTRGGIQLKDGTEGTAGKCIVSESATGEITWTDCPQTDFDNINTDPFAQSRVAWDEYDDSSADMVDGTGGSPVASFTPSASYGETQIGSGVHVGAHSFSKAATNKQGAGISKDFTVPQAMKDAGYIYISGYYSADVALSDGDMTLNAFDVTNSELLPIYGVKDNHLGAIAADKVGRFTGVIYIPNDIATVRIGFHVSTTSTAAINFYHSGLKLSLNKLVDMPVKTTPKAFTPTFAAGTATFTGESGFYWREGRFMHIEASAGVTATGSTTLTFTIPESLTIDTDYVSNTSATSSNSVFGGGKWFDSGSAYRSMDVFYASTTTLNFMYDGGAALVGSALANNDKLSFHAKVPIEEWDETSTGVVGTQELINQTVRARYGSSSTGAVPNSSTVFDFSTEYYDTHDAVTTGASWKFTAPKSGYYKVDASFNYTSSGSASRYDTHLQVNGSIKKRTYVTTSSAVVESSLISDTLYLQKGDYIDVVHYETVNGGTYSVTGHFISIDEMPNLSVFSGLLAPLKTQTKYLTADVTTDTTVSDLTFSNLEVGKWYRVNLQAKSTNTTSTVDNVILKITHNSSTLKAVIHGLSQINDAFATNHVVDFKAEATTVTFVTSSMTNGAFLGDSTRDETHATLSEIHPKQVTSEW